MHTRRNLIIGAVAGLAMLGGGTFGLLYFVVLAGRTTPPLALSSPPTTRAPAWTGTTQPAVAASGTWTVDAGSVAGYRVREQLGFLPEPSDAVGRTGSITGSVTITQSGNTVTATAASFSVDVSTLTSDRPLRDQRIHELGLESDRYPTASFELARPVSIANAAGGQTKLDATGRLTIHGVTRTVTIPLQAQLNGSQPEVVGSLSFPFGDFGMNPPSIGGFVSVQDNATMEFDLKLKHA